MKKRKMYDCINQTAHLHCIAGVSGVGKTSLLERGGDLGLLDASWAHVVPYGIKADTKIILKQGDLEATLAAYEQFMLSEMCRAVRALSPIRHFLTDRSPLCYTTHYIVDHMDADAFAVFPNASNDSPLIMSALGMLADFVDNVEYFYVITHPLKYPRTDVSALCAIENRVRLDRALLERVAQSPAFKNYRRHLHRKDTDDVLAVSSFLANLEVFQTQLLEMAPIKY